MMEVAVKSFVPMLKAKMGLEIFRYSHENEDQPAFVHRFAEQPLAQSLSLSEWVLANWFADTYISVPKTDENTSVEAWGNGKNLARYDGLWKQWAEEFKQLSDEEKLSGNFVSSVDNELWELEEDARRFGFCIDWDNKNGELVHSVRLLTPHEHVVFLHQNLVYDTEQR